MFSIPLKMRHQSVLNQSVMYLTGHTFLSGLGGHGKGRERENRQKGEVLISESTYRKIGEFCSGFVNLR
jgi:hypothetical protein